MYPMRVSKNPWNSHHFGQFFRRGRDAVDRFFESLQRTKVKIRCCKVIQVLLLLADEIGEFLFSLKVILVYCHTQF